MKNFTLLLIITLFSQAARAEEKPTTLEIFEAAYKHLQKGNRILSVEYLQHEGVTVAYYMTVGTEESKRENGILVSAELDVPPSVTIEQIAHLRYAPPRIKKVTHKGQQLFHMPTISEEEYLKKGLEPAGTGQPM